ncbi:MAG: radical SAM protein [Gammaproteobacteria bacterium]|nr:radical SAM protein [Gammaproteobacteria bacterium]
MKLKIIETIGDSNIATVYIAETPENKYLEFVESVQPPLSREDKWVLVISVLFGCPVGCLMCDAGSSFAGALSQEEIFAQIDCLVDLYYPDRVIACKEFKIQFARMGDPALNPAILTVLEQLPERYICNGLMPSFSTVAPFGCDDFLLKLTSIKNRLYPNGKFQMQFSIHTTDQDLRDKIIPIKKWDFSKIAAFGQRFYMPDDRKIVLNFALAKNMPVCVSELKKYFSPEIFIIKITPVNPTVTSLKNNLDSYFVAGSPDEDVDGLVDELCDAGYDVILSIGDLEENKIGSNCGQYVRNFIMNDGEALKSKAYSYVADKAANIT